MRKRILRLNSVKISLLWCADLGEKIIRELAVRENAVDLSLKSKEIVTIAIKISPENSAT